MLFRIQVGQIGTCIKTHGVKGELVIKTDMYIDETLTEKDPLFFRIDEIEVPFFIEQIRHLRNDQYAVKIKNIDTKEHAANLVNKTISLPDTGNDSVRETDQLEGFYFTDITSGKSGHIVEINQIHEKQILLVLQMDNQSEALVPYHQDFIEAINPQDKTITFIFPDGIFDL